MTWLALMPAIPLVWGVPLVESTGAQAAGSVPGRGVSVGGSSSDGLSFLFPEPKDVETPMTRGGRRPGSGRPKTDKPRRGRQISADDDEWRRAKARAKKAGMTVSAWIIGTCELAEEKPGDDSL